MKIVLIILAVFIFSACSHDSSDVYLPPDINNTLPTPTPIPPDINNTNPDLDTNPLYSQQWSINHDIDFYSLNAIDEDAHINPQDIFQKYSGRGIKVAVIDDGFDVNHPEIKEKIIKMVSVDRNGILGNDVSHVSSGDYHGSAVAGIIAASNNNIGIMGVAPEVELILIRMAMELMGDDVYIELFKQAIDAGADLINCSWGTGEVSPALENYIDEISTNARDGKGVIIVFASGNSNKDMGNDESAMDSVVGVGATDKTNLRTSYSDYGKDLDIVVPGGDTLGITTIDPLGNSGASSDEYNRYDEYRDGNPVSFIGTSASAPIMTGVIALALQKDTSLTRVQIQELLKKSTSTIGQNTPYLDDMIVSSSDTPVITGLFGSAEASVKKVLLTSNQSGLKFGPYGRDDIGNNEWSSSVTDSLSNGFYTIEVVSEDRETIWATDEMFEVNSLKEDLTDKSKRKSDFYGYGKIDLDKFISNI